MSASILSRCSRSSLSLGQFMQRELPSSHPIPRRITVLRLLQISERVIRMLDRYGCLEVAMDHGPLLLCLEGRHAREAVCQSLVVLIASMFEEGRGARRLEEGRLADGALDVLGGFVLEGCEHGCQNTGLRIGDNLRHRHYPVTGN